MERNTKTTDHNAVEEIAALAQLVRLRARLRHLAHTKPQRFASAKNTNRRS